MRGKRLPRRLALAGVIVVDLLLFVAVFFLMRYAQNLLQNDARVNLTEIVTQNKAVISSKLELEMKELDMAGDQMLDRYRREFKQDTTTFKDIYRQYAAEKGDERLFLALPDGTAIFSDGAEEDVAGRQYFRLAMEGRQNISERTVSRRDGADIFVISVPIVNRGEVVATVQKQYSPEQMYEICAISLFAEKGYAYIINSEGYILISSEHNEYRRESDNYYRILYRTDPRGSMQLQGDIQDNCAGFMETEVDGRRVFSAYTPLDTVYDWYLISSVDTSAISANAAAVIRLFYGVLVVLALLFSISMGYFFQLKARQRLDLERVVFLDNITGGDSYSKFRFDVQTLQEKPWDKPRFLLMFDIDNFKYINSVYGFETGDRILRRVREVYEAKLLADEQMARVYSDHFVVLLTDASPERLETLYEAELTVDDVTVYLSAGLYPMEAQGESLDSIVDKATLAAQRVKGLRYKQIGVYSVEVEEEMQRTEAIKRAVEQALASGEIIAYFQPKVDINSGKLTGAEALARWRTADGEIIPPGNFIPVCEKTALIVAVDMAVFESTLCFLRRNLDAGVPCTPISVNFSRLHLLRQDFLSSVLEKLWAYEVPPSLVELELTETVMFDNYQKIADFIDQVHANGLRIAMDDFGSGFSSLHMLKDMDIDILKIDRGFLQETAKSSRQEAVFASIAQMAERLEMEVVVEGVETQENIRLMREHGCSIAQGFYYAKPLPVAEFEEIYRRGYIK